MRIVPVPVLDDNYAYLMIDEQSSMAAAVDPADAREVIAMAAKEGVTISTVLTTHKHWDHAGGNEEMAKAVPGVEVVGGTKDGVAACTRAVGHRDRLSLGSIAITCLHTPGHTMGHVCYYVADEQTDQKAVFTGDTLFVGGAGKFFNDTPQDMHASLYGCLASLPPQTMVYCGHEYTVKNYRFAKTVEPENEELEAASRWAQEQVAQGKPTVPSTIAKELATNPFMRADQPPVQAKTGLGSEATVAEHLGRVRAMKDAF